MNEFSIQTADQLAAIVSGFRKSQQVSQAEMAKRLGVAQQTYSVAERNAGSMSVRNLLAVLDLMGVEMVLRPKWQGAGAKHDTHNTEQW